MCDLFSWGVLTSPEAAKKLGKRVGSVIFLTDSEMEYMIGDGHLHGPREYSQLYTWDDVIGHHALANYYHIYIDTFEHRESHNKVPRKLAEAVNRGELDHAMKSQGVASPYRYTKKGTLKHPSDSFDALANFRYIPRDKNDWLVLAEILHDKYPNLVWQAGQSPANYNPNGTGVSFTSYKLRPRIICNYDKPIVDRDTFLKRTAKLLAKYPCTEGIAV